jgi:SAM-dependent methyltransferase
MERRAARHDWYPDELAHAGAEHLDADYVAGYDAKAATDPGADLELLLEHGLDAGATLVDLGAGTGTFALAAAPLCRRVVAVDVSRPMLDVLRRALDREGIGNVDVVQAGFLSYEHAAEPADVVYSRHALHHVPDFWKVVALRRIATILRPGGTLVLRDLIYSVEPDAVDDVIEAWLGRATADPAAGWTRDELATHVREEFSPFSWLLEPMLERTGFVIREVRRHGPTYSTYVCERR